MRKQKLAYIFASKYLQVMNARRDVFQAIADPTRREIIGLIAQKPQMVNSIAERFNVSRQAISLHLKILIECGLVDVKQKGRERICEARLDKLNEVAQWVEQYKQFWEQRFDALDNYLVKLQNQNNNERAK